MRLRNVTGLVVLLMSCIDYGVERKIEVAPEPEALPGEIAVNPERVDGVACGDFGVEVTVMNVGAGDLEIVATSIDGLGDWTIEGPEVPFVLGPGEQEGLNLVGLEGDAELVVRSDDPNRPAVVVPLELSVESGPSLQIVSPSHNDILDIGVDVVLEALVTDDLDAAADVQLSWSSNQDGALGNPVSDAAGFSEWTWASADRSPGPQQLTLAGIDSCGNTSSTDITVCQQAGYTTDELDISNWHFEGAAQWDSANTWLLLTPASTDMVGSAFQTSNPVNGDSVSIRFQFLIGGGSGADGISLTALDTGRMSGFLGGTGCGIGYGGNAACSPGPALPGWSIEVDTYYNGGQDPTDEDHVAFSFDGNVGNPSAWAVLPEMEDTGWHTMEVVVASPRVTISIDGVVYIDQDLSGNFSFPAYVGFTAGTGGLTNEHLIDSLEVEGNLCE